MFTHPTDGGGLFNLNWFQVHGKGAATSAPPDVTATATPETGQAPLNVAFDATATDPEGEALTYLWDFGVTGTDDRHLDAGGPDYTYVNAGTYTAKVTVTDASGHQGQRDGHRARHGRAQPVPEQRQVRRVQRHVARPNRWTVQRSADNFQVRDGQLELPITTARCTRAARSAKNIITQPTPSGTWTVTAKVAADADRELPPGRPARVVRRRQLGVGAHDLGRRQPPVRVHLRGRRQPAQRRRRQQRRAARDAPLDLLRAASTRTART